MTDEIKTHYRACHLCEAICGLEIKTQGEQILSIKGDKADPFSRGHICPKGTAVQDVHFDPDRLKKPVKKVDGDWQEIEWEEAFELVAEQLVSLQQEHGDNAVAVYAGNPGVHNYGNLTHGRVLRKALRTRNNFSATSLDQLPHHLSAYTLFGHQFLVPVPDIDRTDFMLIIGGNPLASNGSMMTVPDVTKRLKNIQERGGEFVVIDPRRTETASIADAHHFIKPGSDAYLLLAMLNTLFTEDLVDLGLLKDTIDGLDEVKEQVAGFTRELAEARTGIAAGDILALTTKLAQTPKAVVYGRMGVSVQVFGSVCQWAINLLNILSGHMDREGGAMFPSSAVGYVKPGEPGKGSFGRFESRVSGLKEFGGELPSTVLAEEILTEGEGQIKALVTIAGNPVISSPNGRQLDTALDSLEFMVCVDFYINETTQHADVILPPTEALEHDHYDVAFHRLAVRDTARYNEPVFEPSPDAKHDWQIFNELGAKIGQLKELDIKPLPAPHMLIDMGLQMGPYGKASGNEHELSIAKLKTAPHGIDLGALKPSLLDRLCTENGRINIAVSEMFTDLERVAAQADIELSEGQLLLIGRRHVRSNNSWLHNSHRLVKGKPRWHLLMNPEDMTTRDIKDGSEVLISSRVGELTTTVSASEEIMPGVVSLPHGWGQKRAGVRLSIASQQDGVSVNDLTDHELYDAVTGNAALNGVPVQVRNGV